ncbi:MAG: hypothetical protein ACKOOC_05720 [Cyanobium sp.]
MSMMRKKIFMRTPSILLGFGLVVALGLIDARPGQAVCLSSGNSGANDCLTFDGSTSSLVTQIYSTTNLTTNNSFQLGFYSSNSVSYSISNVFYSQDNTTLVPIGTGSITTGTGGFSSPNYFASISPITINVPFYIKYVIDGPVAPGVTITSKLLSNSNNATDVNGVLVDNSNDFVSVSRNSTAVPAPLPILGAAAAFARVKRFRNNSKILSRMG